MRVFMCYDTHLPHTCSNAAQTFVLCKNYSAMPM